MFRILDNEAVILNLASGIYFGLDTIGTRIWQLITEHGSPDRIIPMLLEEYDVEEAQLRGDLDRLLQQLVDKELIKTDAQKIPPSE